MKEIKSAEEFLDDYINKYNIPWNPDIEKLYGAINAAMILFAQAHIEKIKMLQRIKYLAGETGYIKNEEWEEIINEIK